MGLESQATYRQGLRQLGPPPHQRAQSCVRRFPQQCAASQLLRRQRQRLSNGASELGRRRALLPRQLRDIM